jgi:hypothetical protein
MSSTPDFRLTWLWRHAFANPQPDVTTAEQEFFRDRYLAMRERVGMLVSRIGIDMPSLTIHDLSHLDALWETASLVSEGAITVNPAEAFVFGASVLLHDAAMSLAAFPNGLTDLKQSLTWKDTVASLMQGNSNAPVKLDDPPSEIVQRVIPEVLRRLHAQQAAVLAEHGWTTKNGDVVYLIEDEDLRFFYGQTIGQIACSHWWPIARVEQELQEDLGALPQRTKSRIDRVKLACLLRVADALHLDQRRAPRFLRLLVQPQGVSALHWAFQERLATPHVELDAVVFTAGSPFTLMDADAWWLAYDTMTAVDRELRDVDLLMQNRGRGILRARRVKGAGTPESLARTIQTRGWRPVDTQLRVSDIPKIVETLGGEKLYGDDPTIPLRELIQNSADAVQARRKYQERAESWGLIKVALSKREDEYWLSIEDNGIGMSEQVLTGPLIDFGNSFWRSPLVTEEFPGLIAAGMTAIGRYGIGFFSVFMLGSVVRVISRRCDRGEDTARVLEFRDGTASRPILYPASMREAPLDGGTRIEIKLKNDPRGPNGLLRINQYKQGITLQQLVAAMAPNMDVAIETLEEGKSSVAVSPSDWLNLDDEDLLLRLDPIFLQRPVSGSRTAGRSLMRTISDATGKVFGRAFIRAEAYRFSQDGGWVTVGGLRAKRLANIQGVLLGEALTAARDSAIPTVSREILAEWATEQARLIADLNIDEEQKARSAEVVLECGGQLGKLPIARWGDEWIDAESFWDRIAMLDEVVISFDGEFSYDEDRDDVHPRDFHQNFTVDQDIIVVPKHNGEILSIGRQSWPNSITGRSKWSDSNLETEIKRILNESWVEGISHSIEERKIGTVGHDSISRAVDVFRRGGSDVLTE